MNVTVPVKVFLTTEQAITLAPSGEMTCTVCATCFALVPVQRLIEHGKKCSE